MHLGYYSRGATRPTRVMSAKRVPVGTVRYLPRNGLAGLGESGSVGYAKQGASLGASVGSVVPGIGTAIGAAVGAILGAIGGAFVGSRRPESDLWDEYKKVSGQTDGSTLNNQFRNGAFVGLFRFKKNTFPPRYKYGGNDDARFLNDMVAQIVNALRAGTIGLNDNAASIFAKVVDPWVSTMGKWSDSPVDWQRWMMQILIDQIDAYIHDMPIIATSYTTSGWAQPKVSDVLRAMYPEKAPVQSVPVPTPSPAAPPPPVIVPVPPPTVAPPQVSTPVTLPAPVAPSSAASNANVSSAPAQIIPAVLATGSATQATQSTIDALQGTISNLLANGASQQATFQAAMDRLASQGVSVTPQVQQAVAQEVQKADTAQAWYQNPYILAGLAAGGLFFLSRRGGR